ncbi:MAG: hypothetical protein PWQ77_85 [Kosmotogales bacterium]|nr:hypothetical protein [Kosmotogales bacterium]
MRKRIIIIGFFIFLFAISFCDVITLQNYSIEEGKEFVLDLNKILNNVTKGAEFSVQNSVGQIKYGIYTYQSKNDAPSVYRIVIKISSLNEKTDYIIFNLSVINVNLSPEFIEKDFYPLNNENIEEKSIVLEWAAIDPDDEKIVYDVYFGNKENMKLIKKNTTEQSVDITELEDSTVYLWKVVAKDKYGFQKSSDVFAFRTVYVPELLWQRCLGGSENESAYKVLQSKDGYIIVGGSNSIDGNVNSSNKDGLSKGWIIKLDDRGYYMWQRSLGEYGFDKFMDIIETESGNYILTGISYYDKSNNNDFDIWIIEMDKNSYVIWQKIIGGKGDEAGYKILPTSENDFIIVGFTSSNDAEEYELHGSYDFFAIRIDKDGKIKWQNNYGGSSYDYAIDIVETSDKNFVIAGNTRSSDCEIENFYSDNLNMENITINQRDIWLIKIDQDGEILWQDTLGGKGDDFATSILKDKNDDVYIIGSSNTINLTPGKKNDDYDIVVYKIDGDGTLIYRKAYGDKSDNFVSGAFITSDDKILFTGRTESIQNKPKGFEMGILGNVYINDFDLIIFKINENGEILWERKYGGTGDDIGKDIIQLKDKSYLILGETSSNDGDISGNHGKKDILIMKIGK